MTYPMLQATGEQWQKLSDAAREKAARCREKGCVWETEQLNMLADMCAIHARTEPQVTPEEAAYYEAARTEQAAWQAAGQRVGAAYNNELSKASFVAWAEEKLALLPLSAAVIAKRRAWELALAQRGPK